MLIIRMLNCINTASGIATLCKWPFGAQVACKGCSCNLCTEWPLTESGDTRCCINTIQHPDDEHVTA
jgi:hypothetical protein